jgi:ABC-2 type transport system permease protein
MQVYKAFFKVINKNFHQLMIYVVIFLFFAVAFTRTYTNPVNANFTETKINIAFINHDTDSKLVEGLKRYLSKNANIIDISDDTQRLQDALFFRKVEYIVKVPRGFTEGLIEGKAVHIEKTAVPDSTSAIYMDSMINKYLNTVKTYSGNVKGLSQDEIIKCVGEDLSIKTEIKVKSPVSKNDNNERCTYYYNYLTYSLFAILIMGISAVMMTFNGEDLKKRNLCSPVKLSCMNLQMILGNISYAMLTWFILIVTSFIMYGSFMLTPMGLLFILNSFIFTFAALSISYLIATVIKSRNAASAAANALSLGTCFISGAFVPQSLLSKTVLKIASFTPTYWYIKSNNEISSLGDFNMQNLMPIFNNMLIIIGFAVAVLAVTLTIIKQKRMSN